MIFYFKEKTAYEISACLVGSKKCIRDRPKLVVDPVPCSIVASRHERVLDPDDGWRDFAVFVRAELKPGDCFAGPRLRDTADAADDPIGVDPGGGPTLLTKG